MSVQIGVIGGSGLYDMAELTNRDERSVKTPFGDPSGPYVIGTLRGKRVAFLARHGAGHRAAIELNFRANISASSCSRQRFLSAALSAASGRPIRLAMSAGHFSIARKGASARSSATAWSRMWDLRIPFVPSWRRSAPMRLRLSARGCTAAAHTSVWKGRSFRRWRNRGSTGPGGWTSLG